jgi:hypothetical protein
VQKGAGAGPSALTRRLVGTSSLRAAANRAIRRDVTVGPSPAGRPAPSPFPWIPKGGIKATHPGGNTIGTQVREAQPRADGYRHIDTPRLIAQLKRLHVNTYYYSVWDSPTDWDDLKNEFAPAAKKAGIDIWVGLAPPSECQDSAVKVQSGRCSRPFKLDFVSWAREIATLSKQYPNIKAWAVDDFLESDNAKLFTTDYLTQVSQTAKAINPNLALYTVAYYGTAIDPTFYDKFKGLVDGIIYPYLGADGNTNDASLVAHNLDQIDAVARPRGYSVVFLDYSGRFLDAPLAPTAPYVKDVLDTAMQYQRDGKTDGTISYGTQLTGEDLVDANQPPRHGNGRLAIVVPPHVGTSAGDYGAVSQVVKVDPNSPRYELDFWHRDPQFGGLGGYHFKRVLIDGQPVYDSDTADWWSNYLWSDTDVLRGPIDVTDLVKGKKQVTLTFELMDKQGVGDFYMDAAFDDISTIGLDVKDPGFEDPSAWTVSSQGGHIYPVVYVYHRDEPSRIFDVVRREFGGN